jgi:DDE superfamily endonuclease
MGSCSIRKPLVRKSGTLLARGRRTVCTALRLSGEADNAHWRSFHQVLNRARWSPLCASGCLLRLIVDTLLPAEAVIEIAIDETLERRWGPQIHKRGHYCDSALSSRKQSVSSPRLRWIVMAVVVPVPWSKQPWALPFLAVLATTPGVSEQLGLRHHTVGERARQMVRLVHRWLPERPLRVLGDMAYSCLELGVQANHCGVTFLTSCSARQRLACSTSPAGTASSWRQAPSGGNPAPIPGNRPGQSRDAVALWPDLLVRPGPA